MFYQHFQQKKQYWNNQGHKKKGKPTYDPLLMQISVLWLGQTSSNFYRQIARILHLPDLSTVLRYQKRVVGSQGNEITSYGIKLRAIKTVASAIHEQDEVRGSNKCYGAISADSMKVTEGISYDLHKEFTGLDSHIRFDVVAQDWTRMANELVCMLIV